jgi:hypothetical protein
MPSGAQLRSKVWNGFSLAIEFGSGQRMSRKRGNRFSDKDMRKFF